MNFFLLIAAIALIAILWQIFLCLRERPGPTPEELIAQYRAAPAENKFTIHSGFGDHINWLNHENGKWQIWGHMPWYNRPANGDWLTAPMQSGKTGLFRIEDLAYQCDPPDMFFGFARPVAYIETIDESKPKTSTRFV